MNSWRRRSLAAGEELRSLATGLGLKLGLRRIPELGIGAVGPLACGLFRPMILIPSWLLRLPEDQIEAILAHELAHLRRYDLVTTYVQRVAETLFYFHPVVWLIGKVLCEERERLCDDLAVSAIGDKKVYVAALAACAETEAQLAGAAANGGTLRSRIERLMFGKPRQTRPRLFSAVVPIVVGLTLATLIMGQTPHGIWQIGPGQIKFSGQIVDRSGHPIPIPLQLVALSPRMGGIGVQTLPDGFFEAYVSSGDYDLYFSGSNDLPPAKVHVQKGQMTVTFSSGETGKLQPDGSWKITVDEVMIEGRVVDADGIPVQPDLKRPWIGSVRMFTTNVVRPDGTILYPGSSSAFVGKDGAFKFFTNARSLNEPQFVAAIDGQIGDRNARLVNLTTTIHLHRVPRTWVVGRIIDREGRPVEGAEISPGWGAIGSYSMSIATAYANARSIPVKITSDRNGEYRFGPLMPGEEMYAMAEAKGFGGVTGATFKLRPGDNRSPDIVLPRANRTIRGRVVDYLGQPAAGAKVTYHDTHWRTVVTDAQGRFVFDRMPESGPILLIASKHYGDSGRAKQAFDGIVIHLGKPSR